MLSAKIISVTIILVILTRHSMPSLPSLFADHSLTYVNGRLLLCGGSHAAR